MALMAVGGVALLSSFVGAVMAIATDADPLRAGLAPVWAVAIVFGALSLRIAFIAARMPRGGGRSRIDEQGITNLKDGIGPIAWTDIRGASIMPLKYVPRTGSRWALFVDVPDVVARRHIGESSLLARMSR